MNREKRHDRLDQSDEEIVTIPEVKSKVNLTFHAKYKTENSL